MREPGAAIKQGYHTNGSATYMAHSVAPLGLTPFCPQLMHVLDDASGIVPLPHLVCTQEPGTWSQT